MPNDPGLDPAHDFATSPDERKAAQPQRYGRYILLDRVGTGGMAEVFRALVLGPQRFQRIIVVKRILPEISQDPRFVQMFIDEANICARLSHPNIVQIYEFGQVNGTYFIAMEHVHGRNLRSVMARLARAGRTMPSAIAADLARQVCLGLDYAHTLASADGQPLNIIHRDISPTNIMVSFTGGVKLLDFGIARAASEVARGAGTSVKGKLSYVAPEQIQFGEVDRRADVFALGVVLHEAITGHRLFKADNDAQRMKLVLEMPVPRPSSRNPAVPATLDRIVMRALERNPARRYGSAAEMAADLERYLLDARHSSQDTATMLRGFFAAEMTAAHELGIPKVELERLVTEAMAAAATAAGSGPAEFEGAERTGTMTGTSTNSTLSASDASLGTPAPEPTAEAALRRQKRRARTGLRHALASIAALGMLSTGVATGLWLAGELPGIHARTHDDSPVRISFDSTPQEARVYRQDSSELLGTTPFALELPRGMERVTFQVELSGYVPATIKLLPDFDKPLFVSLQPLTQPQAASTPAAPPSRGRPEAGANPPASAPRQNAQ